MSLNRYGKKEKGKISCTQSQGPYSQQALLRDRNARSEPEFKTIKPNLAALVNL
jgi:hypothetical protein